MSDNVAKIMHDTVCVVAFVALAIAFRHWWLVSFALIFFIWPSSVPETTIITTTKDTEDENNGR